MATGSKLLEFVSENDTNGLISWLGTNGGAQPFEAPAANVSGKIDIVPTTLCSSNLGGGDLEIAARGTIERADGDVHSANAWNQWYKVSLPGNATLTVNHIAVRDRAGDWQNALGNFNLEASVDDVTWDILASNTTPIGQGAWRQFPIAGNTTAYKHFRLISTGGNAQGNTYLAFCEFEFYGYFFNGIGSVPSDYIARYTMDTVVANTLKDETGDYDGVITGATQVDGVRGKSLDFGVGHQVDMGFDVVSDNTGTYTFALWLNMDVVSGVQGILGRYIHSGGYTGLTLSVDGTGALSLNTRSGAGTYYFLVTEAGAVTAGEDIHIVAEFNVNGGSRLWLNAVEQSLSVSVSSGTVTTYSFNPAVPFTIGRTGMANGAGVAEIDGKIDELFIYDRSLISQEIQAIYLDGALHLGLMAHYTMDNIEGALLLDETANYDGSITGATQIDGYLGQALSFSGADNYVDLGNVLNSVFVGAAKFSISLWINAASLASGHILSKHGDSSHGDTARQFFLSANSGKIRFGWYSVLTGSAYRMIDTVSAITDDNYHHIIATYDGSVVTGDGLDRVKIYIDGTLAATIIGNQGGSLGTIQASSARLSIGAAIGVNATTASYEYTGKIDQLRIYNRELSQLEISSLYYEQLLTKILQGTITETLSVINWLVRCYRLDTGLLTGEAETTDGAFAIDVGLSNDTPHMVTVIPEQGIPWKRNITKAIGDLVYPADPSTAPYYYKATTAGATGDAEPPWVTTPGQTVADNEVTWECVERLVQPITHSPLMPV